MFDSCFGSLTRSRAAALGGDGGCASPSGLRTHATKWEWPGRRRSSGSIAVSRCQESCAALTGPALPASAAARLPRHVSERRDLRRPRVLARRLRQHAGEHRRSPEAACSRASAGGIAVEELEGRSRVRVRAVGEEESPVRAAVGDLEGARGRGGEASAVRDKGLSTDGCVPLRRLRAQRGWRQGNAAM